MLLKRPCSWIRKKKKKNEERKWLKKFSLNAVDNEVPNPNARSDYFCRKYSVTINEGVEHIFKDCLTAHNE